MPMDNFTGRSNKSALLVIEKRDSIFRTEHVRQRRNNRENTAEDGERCHGDHPRLDRA